MSSIGDDDQVCKKQLDAERAGPDIVVILGGGLRLRLRLFAWNNHDDVECLNMTQYQTKWRSREK